MTCILGIDCSERIAHVAIVDYEADGPEVLVEKVSREEGSAEALTAMIAAALQLAGIGAGDLDEISVALGPGSFTGIRAGISTAQGLAAVRNVPVRGISTLVARSLRFGAADSGGEKRSPVLIACMKAIAGEYFSVALMLEENFDSGVSSSSEFSVKMLSPLCARSRSEIEELSQLLAAERGSAFSLVELDGEQFESESDGEGISLWGPAALTTLARAVRIEEKCREAAGLRQSERGAGEPAILQSSDCGIGLIPLYGKKPSAKTLAERGISRP